MTLDVNYDMTISAIAYDSNNQIMPNGTIVTFQTNGFLLMQMKSFQKQKLLQELQMEPSVRSHKLTTAGSFTVSARIGQIYAENPKI